MLRLSSYWVASIKVNSVTISACSEFYIISFKIPVVFIANLLSQSRRIRDLNNVRWNFEDRYLAKVCFECMCKTKRTAQMAFYTWLLYANTQRKTHSSGNFVYWLWYKSIFMLIPLLHSSFLLQFYVTTVQGCIRSLPIIFSFKENIFITAALFDNY